MDIYFFVLGIFFILFGLPCVLRPDIMKKYIPTWGPPVYRMKERQIGNIKIKGNWKSIFCWKGKNNYSLKNAEGEDMWGNKWTGEKLTYWIGVFMLIFGPILMIVGYFNLTG